MKRIIYYVLLITSIFCLQVRYAVAGSNKKLTSESIALLAVGTTARGLVVRLDLSSGSGSNFIININGRDVTVNHRVLARYIEDDPDLDNDKILLLSCSNFTAAQNLANKLGKHVIATDGIVRIYSDGGLLSFKNGAPDLFEEYVPNAARIAVNPQPRKPTSTSLAYVSMGENNEMVAFLAMFTLPETKAAITGLSNGDQQDFLADYKAAPATTFTLFNTATTGPKMIEAWVTIKDRPTYRNQVLVLQDGAEEILNDDQHAPLDPTDLDEVTGTSYVVGARGNWNKDLNTFPPTKTTYEVKMYGTEKCINTVEGGRVTSVTLTELRINPSDRNPYQQAKCKRVKNGITDQGTSNDDGGHLIGAQFGGTGEQINYVPMPPGVNRSGGSWYAMEQAWANYLSQQGNSPRIKNLVITIIYSGNSKKPTSFKVTWDQYNYETDVFERLTKNINNY